MEDCNDFIGDVDDGDVDADDDDDAYVDDVDVGLASVCLNTSLTGAVCPSVPFSVTTTMVKTSQTNCGNACVSSDN